MNKEYVYLNGTIMVSDQAMLPVKDQGLLVGYGIFETIRVYNAVPFLLRNHLIRLMKSLDTVEITAPSIDEIQAEVYRYLSIINLSDGVIRITVTKGVEQPNIIFTQRNIPYSESDYERGFTLKTVSIQRNQTSPITYMKTTNYLENLLAKKEAIEAGFDEAILLNTNHHTSECSASNIFCIKDHTLYTPALKCGLLNGIVRELIINEIADMLDFKVCQGEYKMDFFYQAEEVFITNSVLQIMPVIKIDHATIAHGLPGVKTKKFMLEYNKYVSESNGSPQPVFIS